MHRFLLHGYITIYSDEEYEKIVKLMEEDELFPLITDFLNKKISTDIISSKLDAILLAVNKLPEENKVLPDTALPTKNTEPVAEVQMAVPEISGTVATIFDKLNRMRKR